MNEPSAPVEGRREARARLIATPIILVVLGGILWIHDATGVAIGTYTLITLFAAAAGAEMSLLFKRAGRPARPVEAAVWCWLLCLAGLVVQVVWIEPWLARSVMLIAAVVGLALRHITDTRPEAIDSIASRLMPILFVGFLFSSLMDFGGDARFVLWIVLIAKASDMAGWAVGVPLGRHKMIPSVSPGKSWEGTVAGIAASVLVAVFFPRLVDLPWVVPQMSIPELAALGLLLGTASVLAGVLWSGWKRRLGAKDSSALIPAMGGVMDMVDSLLLAVPAAHLFFVIRSAL